MTPAKTWLRAGGWKAWCAAICLTGSFLVSAPGSATELSLAVDIWCDTAEQTESVVRSHLVEGVTLPEAAQRVNLAEHNPAACIAAAALATEDKEIRQIVAGTYVVAIRSYTIMGLLQGNNLLVFPEQTWFRAISVARLTKT